MPIAFRVKREGTRKVTSTFVCGVLILLALAVPVFPSKPHLARPASSSPQTVDQDRQYEHVQLQAFGFPDFSGNQAAVNDLFLYAYHNGSWKQIPLQIDERDESGSYFGTNDGLLDDNDQLLFMARDAGERASANDWIPDLSARSAPRYEIALVDPITSAEAWVYLYRSITLNDDPQLQSYMRYAAGPGGNPAADTIRGASYVQGHANNGIPDYLAVPQSFGGTNVDFLDRVKLRVRAVTGFGTQTLNERDNFKLISNSVRVVQGRVRVIREVQEQITITIFGTSLPIDTVGITLFFYPFAEQLSGTIILTSSLNARLLRVSFDFDQDVVNQPWHNQNTGPRTLTGASGGLTATEDDVILLPQRNWFSMISSHGSFTSVFGLESITNTAQQFYFWDSQSGTADGTPDTGDGKSYGDSGFLLSSASAIVDTFQLAMSAFILGPNWTRDQAVALNANIENSLGININSQAFDSAPPAAVNDLHIDSSTLTSVTLKWSAPNDAGSNVASYQLAYSTTAVGSDTSLWFNTIAQKATNLPLPASPGTVQSATVENLTTGAKYFFILRSVDDFGNVSEFSNVATIDAVPVELISFTVRAERNRAVLLWQTATETNNLGFAIERRTSAGEWSQAGFVSGHGTTTIPQSYRFTEENLQPGAYQYRLKQIDTDGAFAYSETREAIVPAPERFHLAQNYPNPFSLSQPAGGAFIQYELSETAAVEATLRIFNVLGQEVRRLSAGPQAAGYYKISWDGRTEAGELAPAGIYFYELIAGAQRATRKLAVVR